ncbi:hypothetical protein BUALT_Bualt19G0013300 [Buddleja alternifolia]|uniref:F-box domain-containing protein n=1 Tax=Buddleja alternifolia TaxID=168488 RepID=A0AAV6W4C5_9LAMI|nr:hypothetical protein BUALT_Bualt19G0013300 [Buddleja alternifolia]
MERLINDLLERLESDTALNIFMRLDDPADLVRASAVSHSWRHFVITNGLSKHLCFKIFPQLSETSHTIESNSETMDNVNVDSSKAIEMERDHVAYASLVEALFRSKLSPRDCIADAISASSTDRYPDESIVNTLRPWSRSRGGSASYWSIKGQCDPDVSETLTYKLNASISIVSEINIRPFQDHPIGSAKYVRFRMGHLKSQNLQICHPDQNNIMWTYTSPRYPMKQENQLQQFKLPEPVLCIGGFLQIELSGMVQKADFDGLFYICICYVRVLGLPLKPAFDIDILNPSGNFLLKYYPDSVESLLGISSNYENSCERNASSRSRCSRSVLGED